MDVNIRVGTIEDFWNAWLDAHELEQEKIIEDLANSHIFDFINLNVEDEKGMEAAMKSRILARLMNSYFRDLVYVVLTRQSAAKEGEPDVAQDRKTDEV